MIDNYLKYLQEGNSKNLNEFIVLPIILLINKIYKEYTNYKKLAAKCTKKTGKSKKECIIKHKILVLKKAKTKVISFKTTCKKWSTNIPKCLNRVQKEVEKIEKEINKLEIKLRKLQGENG